MFFDSALFFLRTVANYLDKVQCIIDQYSNYTVKQVNKTVDGINTQGENIADIGGIKESFRVRIFFEITNLIGDLFVKLF